MSGIAIFGRRAWSKREDKKILDAMNGKAGSIGKFARDLIALGIIKKRSLQALRARIRHLRREEGEKTAIGPRPRDAPLLVTSKEPTPNRIYRPRKVLWLEEENQLLIERVKEYKGGNLVELTDLVIAENALPGHSKEGIHERICRIAGGHSVAPAGYRRQWTPDQLARLYAAMKAHPEMTMLTLAEKLVKEGSVGQHTERATESQISRLRRYPPKEYPDDEEGEEWEEGHSDLSPTTYQSQDKFTVMRMMKVTASKEDGSFYVKTVPKTIGEVYIGEPPGKDDIEAILVPQYGGGEYSVINQTTKKVHKRHKFPGPPKDPDAPQESRVLDDDKRPLMMAMAMLDKLRFNPDAWERNFPKVLSAAEDVLKDLAAAREALKELDQYREAAAVKRKAEDDKFDDQWAGIDEALKAEKLVDRELKKGDR